MITGEIKRHFRDTTWDVHVPRRLQELTAAVRVAEAEMTQRLGTAPSAAAIADHLGLTSDELADAFDASAAHNTASLDVPVVMADGAGATLGRAAGRR
jgi:RNA polymerase sigma-B factor